MGTVTSRKTSPQDITLHYRKFLAVGPSRSLRTMWAKYPKNKLVRAVSEQKIENYRFTLVRLSSCQNLKFGGFTSLLCRVPQK